jgi:hypothetical protein
MQRQRIAPRPSLNRFASPVSTLQSGGGRRRIPILRLTAEEQIMARRVFGISGGTVVCAMVVVVFFAAAPAWAHRTGQTCPFSASGLKYLVLTYKSTTCTTAKQWLPKLVADKDPKAYGSFPLHNGPKGDTCIAVRAHSGRAAQGECYTGTEAFPHSGFQWGFE